MAVGEGGTAVDGGGCVRWRAELGQGEGLAEGGGDGYDPGVCW